MLEATREGLSGRDRAIPRGQQARLDGRFPDRFLRCHRGSENACWNHIGDVNKMVGDQRKHWQRDRFNSDELIPP